MRKIISGGLVDRFKSTATPAQKPKKKRPTPLSIRLSDEERAQLREWAGRVPLGTYVKSCLFGDRKPRKARQSNPLEDNETLARLLSALGRSGVFANLDTLIKQVEVGTLDLSDEHVRTILTACACVTQMRNDLIRALGLKAD